MNKLKKYFMALKDKANHMLVTTKVSCCFCRAANHVSFDLTPTMVNFKANCGYCGRDFCYDVELRFLTQSFDPKKLRRVK